MEPDVPPLTCPRCGMVDQVQKVSALVTAGVSTSSGSGTGYALGYSGRFASAYGHMYQSGSQQTLLSERLSPPEEPRLQRAWSSVWAEIAVAGLSILLACSCGLSVVIGGITNNASVGGAGLLLALLAIVGFVVLSVQVGRSDRRLKAAWQEEHAVWEAALEKWMELYYCWRDDVVFFPGSPDAIPAEDMLEVLYE